MALLYLLQRLRPPNPHCLIGREFGISDRRKQIVERREPNCAIDVQQAEILGVGIRITDDQVENSRVRQFRYRSRRMRYRLPKQREAVFEGGAAVAGIFALRSHTERLGEIFLMQDRTSVV